MVDLKVGGKVSFKGACSFTVEQAKNGSSFIKGVVRDRKDSVNFKVWDCTNLEVDTLRVVEIVGVVKKYNDDTYVEAAEVRNVDGSLLDYVESASIDAQTMFGSVLGVVDTYANSWKQPLIDALRTQEGILMCASYPKSVHTERCGFLAHLHEVLYIVCAEASRMTRLGQILDMELLVASVICSKLWALDGYNFDVVTGEVTSEDKVGNTLLGKLRGFMGFTAYLDVVKTNAAQPLASLNEVINAVGSVNHLCEPATPEAVIVRDAFYSELRAYESANAYAGLHPGEIKKTEHYEIAMSPIEPISKGVSEGEAAEE